MKAWCAWIGLVVLLVLGFWYGNSRGISGAPYTQESLDVLTSAVCTITSTTYRSGSGMPIRPVLIMTHGTGYYRFDPYTAVSASNYTPTATSYDCAAGDIIETDHPEWFRIIAASAAFTATVTSFEQ